MRSYQLHLGLRRTVALRSTQHRNASAFLLRRSAASRTALTPQTLTAAHALARSITAARSFKLFGGVSPGLPTRITSKLTRAPRRAKPTPAFVFLRKYLASSHTRSIRSLVGLRVTHAVIAMRARRSRLQNFASIVVQTKLAARRSLFAGVRRARLRKLLKRTMWQKVFRKCRVMHELRRKKIVRRARLRILARRVRASLSCRSVSRASLVRRRFRARYQKTKPFLKKPSKSKNTTTAEPLRTPTNTNRTSKRLSLKPRALRKNIIKTRRFKLFRRATRKL